MALRETWGRAGGIAASLAVLGATLFSVSAPATAAASVAISPMLLKHPSASKQPLSPQQCVAEWTEPCYEPSQIQAAYNLAPLYRQGITGKGQTIVIVDSFGSPTIGADLATFDRQFGLPAPPSLKVIQPAGAVPPFDVNNSDMVGWAGEATLDVEWSHVIAPQANIVLVETPVSETEGTAGFPQIVQAENYVIDHHLGDVISQSFGATEETFPTAQSLLNLRSAYINAARNGVTVLAATGDDGATDSANVAGTLLYTKPVVDWPPSDPLVTAVGGTQLQLNSAGQRVAPDQVWNDTYNQAFNEDFFGVPAPDPDAGNGGKSVIFSRPFYQNSVARVVGQARGVPDISMNAACSSSVNVYESYPGVAGTWQQYCGTSEATPMFAGIVALADQVAHHRLGLINPSLYAMEARGEQGLVDVTKGNNTVSFSQNGRSYTVHGYSAGPGYDLASGVGTLNAAYFVPELALSAAPYGGGRQ